jgi:hypothetical protein
MKPRVLDGLKFYDPVAHELAFGNGKVASTFRPLFVGKPIALANHRNFSTIWLP